MYTFPDESEVALIGGNNGSSLVKVRTLSAKSTASPSIPIGDVNVISISYIVGIAMLFSVIFVDSSPTKKLLFISYQPSESKSTL